jgi:membrane protein YqaA with SNARE-associated domain
MWWQYLIVFMGAMLMDITPLPLPPAFTVMIIFQVVFGLPVWPVIVVGVAGSIIGRAVLSMYIPSVSHRIFNDKENEDIRFLGNKLKSNGWRSQAFILFYTLMPLPSTPLFIAGGMARMRVAQIIPAFCIGKVTSDTIAVMAGKYAAANTRAMLNGLLSMKSFIGLGIGILFISALLFIDWRSLLQEKKLHVRFNIWR